MKLLFTVVAILHGIIHFAGFAKAFGYSEAKGLTMPVSKPAGIAWLIAGLLFLLFAVLYNTGSRYAWSAGFAAVLLSQIMVFLFWKDAKFGSLPNVILLLASLFSMGNHLFEAMVAKEQKTLLTASQVKEPGTLSQDELVSLPAPVKRWLVASGAVGHKKTINGKIIQEARMKMKPEQEAWWPAYAVQYTATEPPSFIWTVDLKMNPFVWFVGRDKFTGQSGEMLIKLNSLVNIVHGTGEKIDEGSLQRLLGEMVWFPSMAASPAITWEEIDSLTAKATLSVGKLKASGTFVFDEQGKFISFSALRYQGAEPEAQRREWVIRARDYRVFDGIKVPSRMEATWRLDKGDWTWLELEINEIRYNVVYGQ